MIITYKVPEAERQKFAEAMAKKNTIDVNLRMSDGSSQSIPCEVVSMEDHYSEIFKINGGVERIIIATTATINPKIVIPKKYQVPTGGSI